MITKRHLLLEAWTDFESEDGDEKSKAQVADLMPKRVKKRRKIETEDGSDQGWEEYFDYIFPEAEAAKPNLKLLAMAKMWKKQKDPQQKNPISFQESAGTDEAEERIPITDDKDVNEENPDADDQDIVTESSDESEDEDDNDHETERKNAWLK